MNTNQITKQGLNVLSLFDGMSGTQIALQRAGIEVANYYSSEIDKYAIKVTQANFPNTIQLGDITKWQEWDLPEIDLIVGGSPCQGFSLAGKQLNFEDPRSKLFFTFVDILNHIKPKYWLMENVKMKKDHVERISGVLGVEPVLINSALVSAQNRNRYYWANFPITQPEDRGIVLKDIIETGEVDKDKAYALDASYYKGGSSDCLKRLYYDKHRRQVVIEGAAMRGRKDDSGKYVQQIENNGIEKSNTLTGVQKDNLLCIRAGTATDIKGHDYNKRIYSVEGKSPTLAAKSGGNLEPKIEINPAVLVGRRLDENGKRQDYSEIPAVQCLEVNERDKSRCLSTVQKDTLISTLEPGRYPSDEVELVQGIHYRKLTPLECERLQTVGDFYTAHVSNTQRYKMLGNGFTVEVIKEILQQIPNE